MKKYLLFAVIIIIVSFGVLSLLSSNKENKTKKNQGKIIFAVSPDYPPLEYTESGKMRGVEIDLAKLIAKKIGKSAEFIEISFDSIFILVEKGIADAAIASITGTPKRLEKFEASVPYIKDSLVVVFKEKNPIESIEDLKNKKVSCQLGSTAEYWAKENLDKKNVLLIESANDSIELLQSNRTDAFITHSIQAIHYKNKISDLNFFNIKNSESSSVIILKQGSGLKSKVDNAIFELEKSGEITKLKNKYRILK